MPEAAPFGCGLKPPVLLTEFNYRHSVMDARIKGLQRIVDSLTGLSAVFSSNVGGISRDTDRVERLTLEYIAQKEEAMQEMENLVAAHSDLLKIIDAIEDDLYRSVLTKMYEEGLSQRKTAEALGIDRDTVKSRHDTAITMLYEKLRQIPQAM